MMEENIIRRLLQHVRKPIVMDVRLKINYSAYTQRKIFLGFMRCLCYFLRRLRGEPLLFL